ncbi:uncharacterized protein LOC123922945 [Trifolium pratense]|uniref:Uncharacterized protein n=1 Tax=Trifolium pratense TaxID=57577 RepID=A0ACB0K3T4_TRIPR|nr:uncharacterized protein LOC123922945 [Trifolium pratense]CAJ2651186.1 unnamed protein product [Trifolium pratense]
MVQQGIVLGHIISEKGISVDPAKIDVISTLPYPSCICEIHSFLGGFYRRFIKVFSKIALPLSNLLKNDVTFNFDDACKKAFDFLKKASTSAPIIQPPDWNIPFEIMCDASNYALGAVLAQRVEKAAHIISSRFQGASQTQIHKLKSDAKHYVWDDPYLWKFGNDQVIRRCVLDYEIESILHHSHASQVGGHFGPQRTVRKVLDSGFYWPTIFKDAYENYRTCKECQIAGTTITRKSEMPQQPMFFCEVFDVSGIDFMGPFPMSFGFLYILLAVDYVSKWVEAIPTRTLMIQELLQILSGPTYFAGCEYPALS